MTSRRAVRRQDVSVFKNTPSALQTALASSARSDILSLAMGLPDPALFPSAQLAEAAKSVFGTEPRALQYNSPCLALKEQVRQLMARKGVHCAPEEILLTHGAQQGVSLIASLLLRKGPRVIEEEYSYPGFQHCIEPLGPAILTVPCSATLGVDIDALRRLLDGQCDPAFVYLMPTAHNPLGVTISAKKRSELASLTREFEVPIIEDDAYGELYYVDTPPAPMRASENRWIYYIGSFSKVIGPSLRVGWVVAPVDDVRRMSVMKEACDLDISTASQWIISELFHSCDMQVHFQTLRAIYKQKRDAFHEALKASFPSAVRWQKPEAGVFFWLKLPPYLDSASVLTRCIWEQRVAFLPGEAFSRGKLSTGFRLNFSRLSIPELEDAAVRIGNVLQSMCSEA